MAPSCTQLAAEDFITAGDSQYANNDLFGALASYAQAAALEPEDAEAWTSHGNMLKELGRPLAAADSFGRAIDAEPDDADLWHYRGVALSAAGCYAHAASSFDRAFQLLQCDGTSDQLADLLVCRGNALAWSDGPGAALDVFAAALALAPTHAAAGTNHANTRAQLFWSSPPSPSSTLPVTPSAASPPLRPYRSASLPLVAPHPRNPLHTVHLSAWLDAPTCARVVEAAEAHAQVAGGWSSTRHEDHATTDIELSTIPALADWMQARLPIELLLAPAALLASFCL